MSCVAPPGRRSALAALFTSVTLLAPLYAARAGSGEGARIAVMLRVLAYDRTLTSRMKGKIVIGVLAKKGAAETEPETLAINAALKQLTTLTLQGLPLGFTQLAFTNGRALSAELAAQAVNVLILCSSLESDVEEILKVTRPASVTTLTVSEAIVRAGAAIGVINPAGGDKPKLVVNMKAARVEGLHLQAEVLHIAQIIEAGEDAN